MVPSPGSSVVIPVDEGETVTIPDGTQLGDLTVKGDGTVTIPENGNVNIDGDLTVEDDATVKVDGGTVNVEGDVIVKGDENGNDQSGSIVVENGGTVTIKPDETGTGGDLVIDGGDVTINDGSVTVDGDTTIQNGGSLTVGDEQGENDASFNTGTLSKPEEGAEASGSVTVKPNGSITVGTVDEESGTVSGGTVDLPDEGYDVTVDGGDLTVNGGTTDDTVINAGDGSSITGPKDETGGSVNVDVPAKEDGSMPSITVDGKVDIGEDRPSINVPTDGDTTIIVNPTPDELEKGEIVLPGNGITQNDIDTGKVTINVDGVPEGSTVTVDENGNLVVTLPELPTLTGDTTKWEEGKWTQDGQPMETAPTEGVVVIDGTGTEGGITVTLPIPNGITDVVIKGDVTFTGDDEKLPTIIVSEDATVKLPSDIGTGDTVSVTGDGTLDLSGREPGNLPTLDGAGENGELLGTIVLPDPNTADGTITLSGKPGNKLPEGGKIVVKDENGEWTIPSGNITIDENGNITIDTAPNMTDLLGGNTGLTSETEQKIIDDAREEGIWGDFDVVLKPNGDEAVENLNGATLEEALTVFEGLEPEVTVDETTGKATLTYAFWFGISRLTYEESSKSWLVTVQVMDANAENKTAKIAEGSVHTLKVNDAEERIAAEVVTSNDDGTVTLCVSEIALPAVNGRTTIKAFIAAPETTSAE